MVIDRGTYARGLKNILLTTLRTTVGINSTRECSEAKKHMGDEEDPLKPVIFNHVIHLDDDQAFLRLPVTVRLDNDRALKQLPVTTFFVLHSVYVAFTDGRKLKSSKPFTRWFNKSVIYLKGHYTHSELAFKFVSLDEKWEIFAACEIRAGEELQWKWKTMNYYSDIWDLRRLSISEEQQHQLLTSCVHDVRRGVAFNSYVYVNFFLPLCLKRDRRGGKVWCSEHVSAKLKEVGLKEFKAVNPYAMDPLELYNKVVEICDTITIHPLRMSQVLKEGLTLPD